MYLIPPPCEHPNHHFSSPPPQLPPQTLHHPFARLSLNDQVLGQAADDLGNLLAAKTVDGGLDDVAHAGRVDGDEALVVHESEEAHDELAIHPVSDPAVAWDRFTEILDLERPLQARGEEAAKWRDERGKGREHQYVQLHGRDHDRGVTSERKLVRGRDENRVRGAGKASQNVGAKILDGACQ